MPNIEQYEAMPSKELLACATSAACWAKHLTAANSELMQRGLPLLEEMQKEHQRAHELNIALGQLVAARMKRGERFA